MAGLSLKEDEAPNGYPQQVQSKADEIIDIYPQRTMIPNCYYDFPINKFRILGWNLVGQVLKREEV